METGSSRCVRENDLYLVALPVETYTLTFNLKNTSAEAGEYLPYIDVIIDHSYFLCLLLAQFISLYIVDRTVIKLVVPLTRSVRELITICDSQFLTPN